MGIRGLESFVKKYAVGPHREPVDVRALAKKYIDAAAAKAPAAAPSAPLVLVDGESLVFHVLESTKIDQFSGGKHAEVAAAAVEFVRVFVEAGFRLHIVFQGMSEASKEASQSERRLESVAACRERLELLNNDRVNELRRSSKLAYLPPGMHAAVKAALCTSELSANVSVTVTDGENDLAIAQYARTQRAVAILAQDSDFFVVESGASYWTFSELTRAGPAIKIAPFPPACIASLLRLPSCLLPLFAALCDNDVVALGAFHQFVLQRYGFARPVEETKTVASPTAAATSGKDKAAAASANASNAAAIAAAIKFAEEQKAAEAAASTAVSGAPAHWLITQPATTSRSHLVLAAVGMFLRELSLKNVGTCSRDRVHAACAAANTAGVSFTRAQWADTIVAELLGLQLPCFNAPASATDGAATAAPQAEHFMTALSKFLLNEETVSRFAVPAPKDRLQVVFPVARADELAKSPALQSLLSALRRGVAPAAAYSVAFQNKNTLAVLLEDAACAFSAHELFLPLRKKIYGMLGAVTVSERSLVFPDRSVPSSIADSIVSVEADTSLGAACTINACFSAQQPARLDALLQVLFGGDNVAYSSTGALSADALSAIKGQLTSVGSPAAQSFLLAALVFQQALAHDGARLTEAVNAKRWGVGAKKKKKEADVNVREIARSIGGLNLALHDQTLGALCTAFVQSRTEPLVSAARLSHVRTDALALRGVFSLAVEQVMLANAFAGFPLGGEANANSLVTSVDGDAFFEAFARLRKDARAQPVAAALKAADGTPSTTVDLHAALLEAIRASNSALGASALSHATVHSLEASSTESPASAAAAAAIAAAAAAEAVLSAPAPTVAPVVTKAAPVAAVVAPVAVKGKKELSKKEKEKEKAKKQKAKKGVQAAADEDDWGNEDKPAAEAPAVAEEQPEEPEEVDPRDNDEVDEQASEDDSEEFFLKAFSKGRK